MVDELLVEGVVDVQVEGVVVGPLVQVEGVVGGPLVEGVVVGLQVLVEGVVGGSRVEVEAGHQVVVEVEDDQTC